MTNITKKKKKQKRVQKYAFVLFCFNQMQNIKTDTNKPQSTHTIKITNYNTTKKKTKKKFIK